MASEMSAGSYVPLSKGIYLNRPNATPGALEVNTTSHPTLVIIFGWMGAKLPHLLKYAQVYEQMYPGATQLLIRSEPNFFWSTMRQKNVYLKPAVQALESLGVIPLLKNPPGTLGNVSKPEIPSPTSRILVHSFSNGGSGQLVTLGELLSTRFSLNSLYAEPLPPSAIILDSAPGSGGISGTQRAFSSVIHNPLLRVAVNVFIIMFYLYSIVMNYVLRQLTTVQKLKAALNSERVLPWTSIRTPRLYIYSKSDKLVPWEQIEEHSMEAESLGLDVTRERFDNSAHVAHMKADPTRYWAAVTRVWEKAIET